MNEHIRRCALACCLVIAGYSCAKPSAPDTEESGTPEAAPVGAVASRFHRGVGAPIPGENALRWTEAYRTRYPGEVRSHFFGRDVIEALLARPGCEGVSMQRAIDDEGKQVLVLVPLDAEGERLPDDETLAAGVAGDETGFFAVDASSPCPPVCPKDLSDPSVLNHAVGAPIPGEAAQRWVEAYQRRHPREVRSHFFGGDVIEALLARPGCEGVSMQRAIDDEGKQVLVLVPLDPEGERLPDDEALRAGAAADETGFFAVDASALCPPYCPK